MQHKTLLEAKNGQILGIENHPLKRRMIEMGMHVGKQIKLLGKAPFGKAYAVQVGGQIYALRQDELLRIQLQ